jgi:hypothetical protein
MRLTAQEPQDEEPELKTQLEDRRTHRKIAERNNTYYNKSSLTWCICIQMFAKEMAAK